MGRNLVFGMRRCTFDLQEFQAEKLEGGTSS
jgi:hypothetical protein